MSNGFNFPSRARNRIRVEEIVLRESPWARYAEWGARYSDLFAAALEEQGTLCIGIYRLLEEEEDAEDQVGMTFSSVINFNLLILKTRVILSCPENSMGLQPMDHIIALVQWKGEEKEKRK